MTASRHEPFYLASALAPVIEIRGFLRKSEDLLQKMPPERQAFLRSLLGPWGLLLHGFLEKQIRGWFIHGAYRGKQISFIFTPL
jgi:hypothetical protein